MFLAASHLSVYTEREKVMWCHTISQSEQSSGIFNLWNITVVDKNQETESLGQNFYFDDTFHLNSSKTEFKCILLIHKCKCIQCNKCILSKITTQSLNQHLSEWQNKQLNRKKMIAIFYCKQNTVQIQFPNYIQDQKRQ